MSATGMLANAVAACKTAITAAGLYPVTDARNARPRSVLIEPPEFVAVTFDVLDITIGLRVLAAPPGNSDALDYLMTTVDTLLADSSMAIVSGRATVALIGTQEIPAYDLTVRIGTRNL
jgi:hypothetical protein